MTPRPHVYTLEQIRYVLGIFTSILFLHQAHIELDHVSLSVSLVGDSANDGRLYAVE